MSILNIPYSSNLLEILRRILLSENFHNDKKLIILPNNLIKESLNFLLKNTKEYKNDIILMHYDELFLPQNKKIFIPNDIQNTDIKYLSKFSLIIEAQKFLSENIKNLTLNVDYNILKALTEYHNYNIDKELLKNGSDNERLLFKFILYLENNTNLKTLEELKINAYKSISQNILQYKSNYTIFSLVPDIILPYVEEFLFSLHKAMSIGAIKGNIIIHGFRQEDLHNISIEEKNSDYYNYGILRFLNEIDSAKINIQNLNKENFLDKLMNQIFVPIEKINSWHNKNHLENISQILEENIININYYKCSSSIEELENIVSIIQENTKDKTNMRIGVLYLQDLGQELYFMLLKKFVGNKFLLNNLEILEYTNEALIDLAESKLFLEILEYLESENKIQNVQIIHKFLNILRYPNSIFYKEYGDIINYLEEYLYKKFVNINISIEELIESFSLDLKSQNNSNESNEELYNSRKLEFCSKIKVFYDLMKEFKNYLELNETFIDILNFHSEVVFYLLDYQKDSYFVELENIIKRLKEKSINLTNIISKFQYIELLKVMLYERNLDFTESFLDSYFSKDDKNKIVLGSISDLYFLNFDIILVPKVNNNSNLKKFIDHGYITNFTRSINQKYKIVDNYKNELSYKIKNFIRSLYTNSGTFFISTKAQEKDIDISIPFYLFLTYNKIHSQKLLKTKNITNIENKKLKPAPKDNLISIHSSFLPQNINIRDLQNIISNPHLFYIENLLKIKSKKFIEEDDLKGFELNKVSLNFFKTLVKDKLNFNLSDNLEFNNLIRSFLKMYKNQEWYGLTHYWKNNLHNISVRFNDYFKFHDINFSQHQVLENASVPIEFEDLNQNIDKIKKINITCNNIDYFQSDLKVILMDYKKFEVKNSSIIKGEEISLPIKSFILGSILNKLDKERISMNGSYFFLSSKENITKHYNFDIQNINIELKKVISEFYINGRSFYADKYLDKIYDTKYKHLLRIKNFL